MVVSTFDYVCLPEEHRAFGRRSAESNRTRITGMAKGTPAREAESDALVLMKQMIAGEAALGAHLTTPAILGISRYLKRPCQSTSGTARAVSSVGRQTHGRSPNGDRHASGPLTVGGRRAKLRFKRDVLKSQSIVWRHVPPAANPVTASCE